MRIFGHFIAASALALAMAELLLMAACVFAILATSGHVPSADGHLPAVLLEPSFLASIVAVLIMVALGLYNREVFLDYRKMAIKLILAFTLTVPAVVLITIYLTDVLGVTHYGYTWYLRTAFLWTLCIIVARAIFVHLGKSPALKRRVVVIGTGKHAEHIRQLAGPAVGRQFVPVAFIGTSRDSNEVGASPFVLDREAGPDALLEFVRQHRAKEIVVATSDRRGLPIRQLLHCKIHGVGVSEYLSFVERESGCVDFDALQPSWLVFSDGFRTGWVVDIVERVFDLAVSTTILGFTLPLLIIIAALVKLDGGPVFYRQERVGRHGCKFAMVKFRSMRVDAENGGKPEWARKNDARMTPLGALLRKVRLDELPQLFNILKGEMAFVGPRPERPFFVEQLSKAIPFYDERHAVKPGLTGWAQIRYPYGASLNDARHKLAYDLYYVKNRSLFLDFLILIETARVIFFPGGAR